MQEGCEGHGQKPSCFLVQRGYLTLDHFAVIVLEERQPRDLNRVSQGLP